MPAKFSWPRVKEIIAARFSRLLEYLARLAEKYPWVRVWPERMGQHLAWIRVSPARINVVIDEISYGSEPKPAFFALLATSTLIACFGLMANSTAVVIGAMLVAPLMTPILGIGLALVRGDPGLLGRAIRAEAVGIVLAVGIASFFGFLPLAMEVTPEMLARTHPNLLDLLVAVLAGFAGSFALINERISPALPGVAIAVAIVPPLANTGLCLSVSAYQGAFGSFLLFTANFLAILLVSAATFWFAGFAPPIQLEHKRRLFKAVAVTGIGFVVVSVILTFTLVQMTRNRYLAQSIESILSGNFSQLPSTSIVRTIHQEHRGKLYILTTIRSPEVLSPYRVQRIQESLTESLQRPTELIVRCISARDISATGSTSQVTAQDLDGFFLNKKVPVDVMRVQLAEQALREILYYRPDLKLLNINLLHFPGGPVILATIQGQRALIPLEVQKFEKKIQDRLQDPNIRFLARCLVTIDVDRRGQILYGWSHFGKLTPEDKTLRDQIEAAVRKEFRKIPNIFPTTVDAARLENHWGVRVEAEGERVISPGDVARLQSAVSRQVQEPIKVYIWSRARTVVTPRGYTSMAEFTRRGLEKREKVSRESPSPAPGSGRPL